MAPRRRINQRLCFGLVFGVLVGVMVSHAGVSVWDAEQLCVRWTAGSPPPILFGLNCGHFTDTWKNKSVSIKASNCRGDLLCVYASIARRTKPNLAETGSSLTKRTRRSAQVVSGFLTPLKAVTSSSYKHLLSTASLKKGALRVGFLSVLDSTNVLKDLENF